MDLGCLKITFKYKTNAPFKLLITAVLTICLSTNVLLKHFH